MTGDRHSGNFRFGAFLLQSRERRLLQDGVPVPLESRAFDLLATLVANAGSLVTKDELLERIWTGRVVEESNLHVHISALRKVLGKHAIATVPRHGYRFTVAVEGFAMPEAMPAEVRHNLPQPLASFVGREDDLAQLQVRLGEARLVTLSGIGGSGKTRLAIKLAERVAPSFRDGVWFVDLAPVADPERVARVVATSLGIREARDTPITETLVRHCGTRTMLLVLDNCEHVAAACASLVERLLTATTGLRVLATTRERLGLPGERVIPVRSLTMPPVDGALDAQALSGYESVRLFAERAREVAPEFVVGPGNAAVVAEVCRRLDGIPLALELAAALLELLSAEQIRERLDDRFRLLTGNTRAVARHRTLLATLTSSYACRTGGDPRAMQRGKALYALGQHHYVRGRLLDALPPTQEALSIAREHGDDEFVVYCLDRICLASSWLGDTAQARAHAEEELVVATRTGNQRLMGFALSAQGGVCRAEGDFDASARAFESALALFDRGQDLNNRYNALVDVARVSIARGAHVRARDTLGRAIGLLGEMGTTYRGHYALDAAARLASACADWQRAARLQGASDSAVDAAGGTRTWFDDRVLASLHAQPAAMLDADAHAAAYDAGRGLPLETALAETSAWFADSRAWNAR